MRLGAVTSISFSAFLSFFFFLAVVQVAVAFRTVHGLIAHRSPGTRVLFLCVRAGVCVFWHVIAVSLHHTACGGVWLYSWQVAAVSRDLHTLCLLAELL